MSLTADGLANLRDRFDVAGATAPNRVTLIHRGRIAVDWCAGIDPVERLPTASVAKSLYVSMLGAAVADGVIGSVDSRVADHYPQLLEVQRGQGPKPDREAGPEDAAITFRHLAGHTSGYLKPGEGPGERFHYQTFGMNVLAHAIAAAYEKAGWRSAAPDGAVRFGDVLQSRLRDRIGGRWTWRVRDFSGMPVEARTDIFGGNVHLVGDARDLALIGWLWACDGNWFGDQVLPAGWVATCTTPGSAALAAEPTYGLGFWLNTAARLWPNLPESSFAAWGRGGFYVWVDPQEGIVAVTAPTPVEREDVTALSSTLIPDLVAALGSVGNR